MCKKVAIVSYLSPLYLYTMCHANIVSADLNRKKMSRASRAYI
jgi:hypothetical protein